MIPTFENLSQRSCKLNSTIDAIIAIDWITVGLKLEIRDLYIRTDAAFDTEMPITISFPHWPHAPFSQSGDPLYRNEIVIGKWEQMGTDYRVLDCHISGAHFIAAN